LPLLRFKTVRAIDIFDCEAVAQVEKVSGHFLPFGYGFGTVCSRSNRGIADKRLSARADAFRAARSTTAFLASTGRSEGATAEIGRAIPVRCP